MICQLCDGDGAIIEIRERWPVFATSDKPKERRERRVICPRCHGEGDLKLRRPIDDCDEF